MKNSVLPLSGGNGGHRWRFFRVGGFDQVQLESAEDLAALAQLDQKLWVVLSCPTRGVEFDLKTLELIDSDKDGRVRVPEVVAAVEWACARLKRPADLFQGAERLPLDAIDGQAEGGRRILASARHILATLGKPGAAEITVADTTDTARVFAQTRFNADGVVPPESADDPALQTLIREAVGCVGGETDRNGSAGITEPKVARFYAELEAYSSWWAKAEADPAAVLPLGPATASGFDRLQAVRAKVDDYFTRCRWAAFDARATQVLNRSETELAPLAGKDFSASGVEAAGFPLARIEAGRALPLLAEVNPAWGEALATFQREVVTPILGPGIAALTAAQWAGLTARFAPYEAWIAAKAGGPVEKLGLGRVREILAGPWRSALSQLIAADQAHEAEMNTLAEVDRLVRYHRDLATLLRNFVSLADFYSEKRKAIFQAGTLYLDGRSCELCVAVNDLGKHASLAGLSKTYLAYCECTRPAAKQKMTIAAAFTAGDSDRLLPGRNGVFYDRKGQDWDATIVKIVEHPISIGQAVWSPYKRIARMIGEQVEKMAAARDKAMQDETAAKIAQAGKAVEQPKAKPAGTAPAGPAAGGGISNMVGVLAAVGLALGAIGTAAAAIIKSFLGLVWWQMPLAVVGLLTLISGPSVVLAWLKLRQRNLGPILDANDWAINGRVKINIPFGGALTATAKLPPNSERLLEDPYAEKHSGRRWLLVLLLTALLGALGSLWYSHWVAR